MDYLACVASVPERRERNSRCAKNGAKNGAFLLSPHFSCSPDAKKLFLAARISFAWYGNACYAGYGLPTVSHKKISKKPYNQSFFWPRLFVQDYPLTNRVWGPHWGILARGRGSTEVRTKTTKGQYFPVKLELARLVSSLLYGTRAMLVFNLPAFRRQKNTQLMTVSTETVRVVKSLPRKNQSERSDLPCHIIISHLISWPCASSKTHIYVIPHFVFLALDLLLRQAQKSSGLLKGHQRTVQYLQHLGNVRRKE